MLNVLFTGLCKKDITEFEIGIFALEGDAVKSLLLAFFCWDCAHCDVHARIRRWWKSRKAQKACLYSGSTQDGLLELIKEQLC